METAENEDPLKLREFLKGYTYSNGGHSMFRALNQIITENSMIEDEEVCEDKNMDDEEVKNDKIKIPESLKTFSDKLHSSFSSIMLRFI
jgi:hypothetical protein